MGSLPLPRRSSDRRGHSLHLNKRESKEMSKAFIDDGYTATGKIAAVEGMYEQVTFEYRPSTFDEFAVITNNWDYISAEEVIKRIVDLLLKKLVSWDLKTSDGKVVEITESNLKRVHPIVLEKIYSIVQGAKISEVIDDQKN